MQSKQEQMKQNFYQLNRRLTLLLVLTIVIGAVLLWYFEIESIGPYSTEIGLFLMGLAIIFYKIPHISYLLIRGRYQGHVETAELVNSGWKSFRHWLDNPPISTR